MRLSCRDFLLFLAGSSFTLTRHEKASFLKRIFFHLAKIAGEGVPRDNLGEKERVQVSICRAWTGVFPSKPQATPSRRPRATSGTLGRCRRNSARRRRSRSSPGAGGRAGRPPPDRKSTRLNSSH